LARPDFRSQAAQRLAAERTDHTPALLDLLRPGESSAVTQVHRISIDRIASNPGQPRQHFDEGALQDLAASIREHGILQPVLVRPSGGGTFQIVAGERRWRAARLAGLTEVPAIVEQIDDESALEIAIIENLQREDISPLEEADMFERMTTQHGYSLRRLAQKLGKDKGYIENRLRLADAPAEVRELVATRSDTLSAAYELMKVSDVRKRRRLAAQVASGELSLAKLRQRIEGRAAVQPEVAAAASAESSEAADGPELATVLAEMADAAEAVVADGAASEAVDGATSGVDDVAIPSIDAATEHLARAVNELALALQTDASLTAASGSERQQFAKYLTIAKIKLENAITVVRSGNPRGLGGGPDPEP